MYSFNVAHTISLIAHAMQVRRMLIVVVFVRLCPLIRPPTNIEACRSKRRIMKVLAFEVHSTTHKKNETKH